MLLGDTCTRNCGFCAVAHGRPLAVDPAEPLRVASAVASLGLRHVVVTSVNRDDLADGGAGHFASTARAIKANLPHCRVEVLVPDFQGNLDAVATVMASPIDVFNHNVETVPRLYARVRPGAKYLRSLAVLAAAAEGQTRVPTKAGLMLGLGEEHGELRSVFRDLRDAGCRILTLGQYLRPSTSHLPVERYVPPEEFDGLRADALRLGFDHVEAGPLVRSSYHAWSHVPPESAPK
jgi:lipoic acid synthetase